MSLSRFDRQSLGLATAAAAGAVVFYMAYKSIQRKRLTKGVTENPYETKQLVNEYLLFHYGKDEEVLEWDFGPKNSLDFPKRCADVCILNANDHVLDRRRALDVGCAVGRSAFELAPHFQEVVGIDYSHSFIDTCNTLKEKRSLAYLYKIEGDLMRQTTASLSPTLKDDDLQRVTFRQGDACFLPNDLGQFDTVLAANLICRLPEPLRFFERLRSLVRETGIVVITTPFSWLEEYTKKEKWIAGFIDPVSKKPVRGLDVLGKLMQPYFKLLSSEDFPFFIREHTRKNQWSVANVSVWQRTHVKE